MIITEPKWKRWVVETTGHIFTPKLCQDIINLSKTLPSEKGKVFEDNGERASTIGWIPFNKMQSMYDEVNTFIQKTNRNHFGFGDIRITENEQFTEYPEGGFYDWHMDCDVNMTHEPPVRKISMTLLLNDPKEFEGGQLELMAPGKFADLKQGHAIIFASFLNHRVNPVTKGMRQSLVVWFGGKAFR